jgi:hypothetical protein
MTNCTTDSSSSSSPSGGGLVVVAILCVVVSSLTTTFGLFFQKIAQERFAVNPETIVGDVNAYNRKTKLIWAAGFVNITLLSFALDLFSMATLGQAMVVPLLASLEVAENQMAAPFMLHEKFDKRRDISAAIIIVVGALSTTLFGPGGPFGGTAPPGKVDACGVAIPVTYAETKAEFGELFLAPAFLVFEAFTIAVFAGCVYGIRQAKYGRYHFLFFGYIAGFLGGQQNMFLKGVGTCFGTAFAGDATVFADYLVYVFIVAMAGLAATQLVYLNRGLAMFPALVFVPTYTVLYIVMGTCVGMVFYQEYKLMTGLGWAMFCVGFMFIFFALAILATKPVDEGADRGVVALTKSDSSAEGGGATKRGLSRWGNLKSAVFLAHPGDAHHPMNAGLDHAHRAKVHAENTKHSLKSSHASNAHIMLTFGAGAFMSHRVMNHDLKMSGHLPLRSVFRASVKSLIAASRMTKSVSGEDGSGADDVEEVEEAGKADGVAIEMTESNETAEAGNAEQTGEEGQADDVEVKEEEEQQE